MLAAVLGGCRDGTDTNTGARVAIPESGPGGSQAEVTVTGRVSWVLGPHLFEIAGDGSAGAAVLVVAPHWQHPARSGDQVEVSGRVRPFRRTVLEAEFPLRFEGALDDLEGRSCLVARRLTASPSPPARVTASRAGKKPR